jgi:hypothetical protein
MGYAQSLTAVDSGREVSIAIIRAVDESAAELARIPPDQLGEVVDLAVVLRLAGRVVVEHLFLVPAVDHDTRHLDPVIVLFGSR